VSEEIVFSQEQLCEMRAWLDALPPVVREVADRFPPGCLVRAVEGRVLVCPGLGELAIVDRYDENEDGSVSVGVRGVLFSSYCDPDWIELDALESVPALCAYRAMLAADCAEERA